MFYVVSSACKTCGFVSMGPWKPRKTDGFLSMGLRTPPTNRFFTNKLDETDDCEICLEQYRKIW